MVRKVRVQVCVESTAVIQQTYYVEVEHDDDIHTDDDIISKAIIKAEDEPAPDDAQLKILDVLEFKVKEPRFVLHR